MNNLSLTENTRETVKCVVWDLDNTIWEGVLLEDGNVRIKDNLTEIIKTLDSRGILQSIASKNNHDIAMQKLNEFGLSEYFIYPQINWNSKVQSIKNIAHAINVGLDTIVFIDDEPVETDEVKYSLPEVICIAAQKIPQLLTMPGLIPRFVTEEQRLRRQMYMSDRERKEVEKEHVGSQEEFLASLNMTLMIFPAREEDLQRAEELTARTNQLNTTGYTYSYDELNNFRVSSKHKLLMARLQDRYGSYGTVGMTLVECQQQHWVIKLLLMSCRVMSRGVGTILLSHVMNLAKNRKVPLYAEFVPNDRNRMMNVTYRFAGFNEVEKKGSRVILRNDLNNIPGFPDFVKVSIQ